jgi:MFS transporter, DHA1 family, multidrug resistance protein
MSLGPALGGWVADWLGFRLLFLASAALVALIFVPALALLPGSGLAPHPASAPPKDPPSWRRLLGNRALLGCWLLTFGGCFGLGIFITFAPLFMKDQGLSVGNIGLVFALQAAVNALSRIPCGRLSDRLERRWDQAIAGFVLLGVALAAFGWAHTLLHFLAAAAVLGFAMGLGFTPVGALIAEVVPPEARGLAMGGYNTCIYLSMMLSSAIMGGSFTGSALRGGISFPGWW